MNYDTLILEMLSRIQVLEGEVEKLKQNNESQLDSPNVSKKISTKNICEHIELLKENALENGETSLNLVANAIHSELNLKSRMPMVCNAMKQCMLPNDVVIYETASGYSSTLEIQYGLIEWNKLQIEKEQNKIFWSEMVERFTKNPRNVQTTPTTNSAPRWFYVTGEDNHIYIQSGKNAPNNSTINGKRQLKREELDAMLDLYRRRKNGEHVSTAAQEVTRNQVYWYGIFEEIGL